MAAADGGGGFKKSQYPVASEEVSKCERFLSEFIDDYAADSKKYRTQLQDIADMKSDVLTIHMDDIKQVRRRARWLHADRRTARDAS